MRYLLIYSFVALMAFNCLAAFAQDKSFLGDDKRNELYGPSDSLNPGGSDKTVLSDKDLADLKDDNKAAGDDSGFSNDTLPRVTLLSADDSGAVIEVDFTLPSERRISESGKSFSEYDFAGCIRYGEAGEPAIYRKNVWVAVPDGATVSITVEKMGTRVIRDTLLYPVPEYVYEDRDGIGYYAEEYSYEPDAYAGKTVFGAPSAEITDSGRFRGFKIVSVGVSAYEYIAGSREMRFNDKIRVNVSFVGGLTGRTMKDRVEVSDDFRRLLSTTIINYDVAQNWPESETSSNMDYDDGNWAGQFEHAYKIWVKDEGLYRLTYGDAVNFGFDVSINPNELALYAANAEELPKGLDDEPEGLVEVPLNIYGGNDGTFDPGDYLEFYGHGAWYFQDNGTDLIFNKNQYTYYNVYWLVLDEGAGPFYYQADGTPNRGDLEPAEAYADRLHYEKDIHYEGRNDYIEDGEEIWFWFSLEVSNRPYNSTQQPFLLNYVARGDTGIDGKLYARLRGADSSNTSHNTSIFLNVEEDGYMVIDEHNWGANTQLDIERTIPDINTLYDSSNQIIVREGDGEPRNTSDSILFSEFEIEYPRMFVADGDYIKFSNPPGRTGWIEYLISGFTSQEITVYDIDNGRIIDGYEVEGSPGDYSIRFQDEVQQGRNWYVALTGDARLPVFDMARDVPSSIRQHRKEDILIICYQDFYDNVIPLANMHRSKGYDVGLYKVDDVYDEFSNGLLDEYAIRNLVKYRYDDPLTRPSYLLLVGDTNYDYRDNIGNFEGEHRNFGGILVPTLYINSYNTAHTASDNQFTCVDGDDIIGDLTVGRLSSYFENNIDTMVAKSLMYGNSLPMGTWRTTIQVIADNYAANPGTGGNNDGSGRFVRDSEELDQFYFPEGYNNFKNYIEWLSRIDPEFVYKTGLNQRRQLTRDNILPLLLENFKSLIVQFNGHGAPHVWAHERVLQHNQKLFDDEKQFDIYRTDNGDYLPIVMQMSCDNNWFDQVPTTEGSDDNREYMDCTGEYFTYAAKEGAIAATGSGRHGYESSQSNFNEGFYEAVFSNQQLIDTPITIGQAFLFGKINAASNVVWENYNLLGDPALTIPIPTPGVNLSLNPETPKRGGIVTVSGTVPDNFDGEVVVEAFDRPFYFNYVTQHYSDGEGGYTFDYEEARRERLLAKGKGEVVAGVFSVDLAIPVTAGWGYDPENDAPRDINDVELKVYAYNEVTRRDYMLGEDYIFGVEGEVSSDDQQGPLVEVYIGDTSFRSGDFVDNNTELILRLNDASGILVSSYIEDPDVNFLALTYKLDDNKPVDISQFLEPTLDDYRSAELTYPIIVPDGTHTITVQVYDSFKNSTTETVVVTAGGELSLGNVLNCPNPFGNSGTYFTFTANMDLDSCAVKVYTVTGKLIQKLEEFNCRAGYNEIFWNGRDRDGDEIANGVYYYKIIARNDDDIASVKEKLIKLR
ncbi:MAG: hypothetical protein GY771_11405 [bacterium]|nr:hypothetical protein [bacterium]